MGGGGGGGCIFIYSCSARRISFEIKFISKEIRRAEHEYMNIHPPINALVTPLVAESFKKCSFMYVARHLKNVNYFPGITTSLQTDTNRDFDYTYRSRERLGRKDLGLWGNHISHRIKISNRRATQRCNVSAFFYAKICSLLARRRSSQPVQRVYWPENVIDWLGKWRPTCVMRHARGQKLQSFRRKWPFYMNLYSMI